MCQSNKNK